MSLPFSQLISSTAVCLAWTILLSLPLASCGRGDTAAAIRSDYAAAVQAFGTTLGAIVDADTAEAAKDDIDRFRSSIERIDRRASQLSDREQRQLLGMQSSMQAEFMEMFQPEITRILSSGELAGQFTSTLMALAR